MSGGVTDDLENAGEVRPDLGLSGAERCWDLQDSLSKLGIPELVEPYAEEAGLV